MCMLLSGSSTVARKRCGPSGSVVMVAATTSCVKARYPPIPTLTAPLRVANDPHKAAVKSPIVELMRWRRRHADTVRMSRITARTANPAIVIRRMPVIPYTLSDAHLWRELALHTTFVAHNLERRMKRSTVITLAVVVLVIALFFYMSTANAREECTVCMEFQGRSNCATAAGRAAAEATETAHRTAGGPIVSGMNETIACENRVPVSAQCRSRG